MIYPKTLSPSSRTTCTSSNDARVQTAPTVCDHQDTRVVVAAVKIEPPLLSVNHNSCVKHSIPVEFCILTIGLFRPFYNFLPLSFLGNPHRRMRSSFFLLGVARRLGKFTALGLRGLGSVRRGNARENWNHRLIRIKNSMVVTRSHSMWPVVYREMFNSIPT